MTTTTDAANAPEVIEGEVVDGNTGPEGEDKSSGADVAVPAQREPEAPQTSDLTEAQARKLADRIKKDLNGAADLTERMNKSIDGVADLMADAYSKRIWLALDAPDWETFVSTELGDVRVRLERGVRQSLVYRMAEAAHMSTRAIAPVFGVDQKTVSNDLRQVRRELGSDAAPTPTRGKDGKEYTSSSPGRKPKPIEDRFTQVIEKADKWVGDLVALSTEDGFTGLAGEVAKRHRADLARLIDALKGVQDRLQ